jgi:hypothetical protein
MIIDKIIPTYAAYRERKLAEAAALRQYRKAVEALPSFAVDPDEDKWKVLFSADATAPYTEANIKSMRDSARELYYQNGTAKGVIDTMLHFVIGKEAAINAVDEDEKVQNYWYAWADANAWDLRSKEIIKRTLRDGEAFMRWFNPAATTGPRCQAIRFLNPSEICPTASGEPTFGIETDPNDVEKVIRYHRQWTDSSNRQHEEYVDAKEIDHLKILVDSDVKRGVSFLIACMPYLRHYDQWLKDRIILNRVRHFFHVLVKPQGISVDSLKSQFSDVTGKTASGGTAKKKLPKTGSVLVAKGVDYEYPTLNINAPDTKDDGRAIQLMICAATCLTEYVVRGDASNANFASTMVSESPMVRMFEAYQDFFEKYFHRLFKRVIDYGIYSGQVPTKTTVIVTKNGKERKVVGPTCTDCQVEFATLIHRDLKAETEAYAIHENQGWASRRTIRGKLGYDDTEEDDQIEKERTDDEERTRAADHTPFTQNKRKPGDQPDDDDDET